MKEIQLDSGDSTDEVVVIPSDARNSPKKRRRSIGQNDVNSTSSKKFHRSHPVAETNGVKELEPKQNGSSLENGTTTKEFSAHKKVEILKALSF